MNLYVVRYPLYVPINGGLLNGLFNIPNNLCALGVAVFSHVLGAIGVNGRSLNGPDIPDAGCSACKELNCWY